METDYAELYKWIEEHEITRPKRNISRDFSDAIPLVEILKKHFPKLVEEHNYSPKNAHGQKLVNWETLNNKVLKKINLHLTKKRIEQLAKGEPGKIEKLLTEVKKKIDAKSTGDNGSVIYLEDPTNNVGVKTSSGNRKTISLVVFEKMQADLDEKTQAVEILQNKLAELEKVLDTKDIKIKDLSNELQLVAANTKPDNTPGSKLFQFCQVSNWSKIT